MAIFTLHLGKNTDGLLQHTEPVSRFNVGDCTLTLRRGRSLLRQRTLR